MKQLLRILIVQIIVLCGAAFNQVYAQASSYVYSYSTPTYVYITGTALATGVSSWDDDVYTNVPIGFTFYFEGQPYNTVGVSSNGFIWFGSGTASTTEYNPISDASIGTGTITGVVAAYASNFLAYPETLQSNQSGAPSISYTTTGTGCSQVFTVQWKGGYVSGNETGEEFGDLQRVDLQITLNENSNAIGIVVRANPYPYLQSSSGQVGIRGAANTDFSSLDCWTAGCDQTANNAARGTLNPSYPATKSEFTFTPPACSYTAPVTSTNAACGNNGTITITPSAGGSYAYQINNAGTIDTNSTGDFSGLGAGTYNASVSNGSCAVSACVTLTSSVTTITASNSGPVCSGDSVTLSTAAVSGAIYSWTGPNGFTSSQQNPVITDATQADSGLYTLVDSIGGCATSPGTTNVVINPGPAAPTAASNSPICAGDSLKLTATTIAGATYAWTGPNSFSVQNPIKPITSLSDSGVYSVVASIGTCHSAAAATDVVITPSPASPVVANNGPICLGDTLKLTASTVAGASYSWTGPNSFNVQNPVIANTIFSDSGVYSVVATIGGCSSLPATTDAVISIAPATPVANNNGPLCTGTSLQLSAIGSSGYTYSWTGPNNFSIQNPSILSVAITDSGVYTVVASAGSCVSNPATTDVVINQSPPSPTSSNNGPLCTGDSLKLAATTVVGATYSWTGPNNFSVQNPVIPSVTTGDSGFYVVIATVGSCSSAPDSTDVVILSTPATPVATNNGPLCEGTALQLNATGNPAYTYTWTGPNNFNTQNPTIAQVTLTDSGTYTVIASAGSCFSGAATTKVVVNPAPASPVASSNSPLCVGDTLNLTATTVNGVTYSWTGPVNFNMQNPTIPGVTLADSGTYVLVATAAGCNSLPDSVLVTVTSSPATPVVSNNGPACLGSSLQLTAAGNPGLSYIWTGPNNFNVQNPLITNITYADTGVYTVVATAGTCTSQPVTTDVAVTPTPETPVASNNGPICDGGNLQLSASTIPSATYTWTGPDAFSTQNPTKNGVTLADSGVYYVVVTVGGCTSNADSTDVVINPNPVAPAISSNSPVCYGATMQLNAPTVSGATYNWTGPNTFNVQNPQKASATTADSGVYSLIITVNGCSSTTPSTENVVVHAQVATPVISANDTAICPNDTATICVNQNYASYSWNTSDVTQCILTSLAGNYYVTVTDGNGCSAVSGHLNLTVYPSPSVSISVSGDTVSAYNASEYQWYFNNTIIPGATDSVYVATKTGEYSVKVTNMQGCSAISGQQLITVLGIQNVSNSLMFQVYPNPASDKLTVEIQGSDIKNLNIRIYDVTGQQIYTSALTAEKSEIDISSFASGVYFLKIGDAIRKFVKN